ncbi:MAG: hypothetical protein MUE52_02820 [Tabrizicola sp.]|nr:hypothetical protein [Tabrizicola sp.]
MLHDGSGCWIPGWLTLDDHQEMMVMGRARARKRGGDPVLGKSRQLPWAGEEARPLDLSRGRIMFNDQVKHPNHLIGNDFT